MCRGRGRGRGRGVHTCPLGLPPKLRMVTSGVEAALQLFEGLNKLSSGLVMAINELRISGVLGVCAPNPLPSMLSSAVAGMFELNMLLLLIILIEFVVAAVVPLFYVRISN